jgi:hypothetical protein
LKGISKWVNSKTRKASCISAIDKEDGNAKIDKNLLKMNKYLIAG